MKKTVLIAAIIFLVSGSLFAQTEPEVTEPEETEKQSVEITPSLMVTAGYVPKSSINALKAGAAFNNLIFNRIGAYTSFEKGLDSDYFTNIYGLTGTVHKNVYLFGGVDLFTKYGLFNDSDNNGVRKELGVGIIPVKNLVVEVGWSSSVGITLAAGLRIPF